MTTPAQLTPDGRNRLERRLTRLREDVLSPLGREMAHQGDDRRLDDDFGRTFAEIIRLEAGLASANILDPETTAEIPLDIVTLGSRVTISLARGSYEEQTTVWIVDPLEASIDDERVSAEAPVASELLGRRVGDVAEVHAPGGVVTCRIVNVEQHPGGPARVRICSDLR
jgi:transcription elongation factor GreA